VPNHAQLTDELGDVPTSRTRHDGVGAVKEFTPSCASDALQP
jgi:hypothetical protein